MDLQYVHKIRKQIVVTGRAIKELPVFGTLKLNDRLYRVTCTQYGRKVEYNIGDIVGYSFDNDQPLYEELHPGMFLEIN